MAISAFEFFAYLASSVIAIVVFLAISYLKIWKFWTLRVDVKSVRFGGQDVIKVLKDHDVKFIFTLIGGHISPIVVSAKRAGMRVIDTRQEATAVFAADAVARISGNIGVAVVTAGPGVTNTVTAVKNAQMAGSPVLLLGGAAATILKGRGSLQDIDQMSLFRSLCKYSVSVSSVRMIVPSIRKAIQVALSGAPGPVFVELPLDVLYPYSVVAKETPINPHPKGLRSKIMNMYLQWYLKNLFGDAFGVQPSLPLPIITPLASQEKVHKCWDMIKASKQPVLVLGSQAVIPASKVKQVQDAVNVLEIPTFLSGMARGLLGMNNPWLLRHKRREALKEADLIILAGAVCDFRLSYGKSLNHKAKVIAINLSKDELFKNAGVFWKPTLAINASVSNFLIRLSRVVEKRYDREWISSLKYNDTVQEVKNRASSLHETDVYLNPLSVLFHLQDVLKEDTVLIADGGDFVATASYVLRPRGPLRWLDPGPFGTLGVGAGFALGAKLCYPKSDVVIIYGDGSLGYSIIEFDTFQRHELPIVAVVGNDACWRQIEREQVPLLGADTACKLRFSDYHLVAKAFGAEGIQIGFKHTDMVSELLKVAFEKLNNSILINILIGKTDFRSGSISI